MTNTLHLALEGDRTTFEPNGTLIVNAAWELDDAENSVELRLFWYTRGKGDMDQHIVRKLPFKNPEHSHAVRLGIQLPDGPYSFSGKLVSLIWALELVAEPSRDASRLEFVMAPGGEEIQLHKPLRTAESP